jgi:hypothetical protein
MRLPNLRQVSLVITFFVFGAVALAEDTTLDSDIQILRSDIRADKTKLVSGKHGIQRLRGESLLARVPEL